MKDLKKKAVAELIEWEVAEDHGIEYTVSDLDDDAFTINFPNDDRMSSVNIKVLELDHEILRFSGFAINTHEYNWENFCSYDHSISWLWKVILWG